MTETVYGTKVTQAYLNRRAAHEAGGPAINFAAGTVIVGDGNGSVPLISQLISANGVLHEVWRGTVVNAVTIDAQNAAQVDILCVIPSTDGSGNEIGPFWIREFAITDENGVVMIVGTTALQKTTGAQNGQTSELAWIAAIGESNNSTVVLTPPAAGFATNIDVYNIVGSRTPLAAEPLYRVDNPNDNGRLRATFKVRTATQPNGSGAMTDPSKLGSGRPATDAEFAVGHADPQSLTPYPWPTLEQVKSMLLGVEAGLLHYGIDTGVSGTAFVVDVSPDITQYAKGDTVIFIPGHDSTGGACTLNADGLGPVALRMSDGATYVPKGTIKANKIAMATHDGAKFRLIYSGGVPETAFWHYGVAGGAANAITCDPVPGISARVPGLCFRVKISASNTDATTFNYGYGGDIPIVINKNSIALNGGELRAGYEAILFDDGTNIRLVNPVGTDGAEWHLGVAGGQPNAIVTVLKPGVSQGAIGFFMGIRITAPNTGPVTLDYGQGTVPAVLNDTGAALAGGELKVGMEAIFFRDDNGVRLCNAAAAGIDPRALWHMGTAAGTASAITTALSPAVPAQTTGFFIGLKIASPNAGGVTVNYGEGTVAVVSNITGNALSGGELKAGMEAILYRDANNLRLINSANAGGYPIGAVAVFNDVMNFPPNPSPGTWVGLGSWQCQGVDNSGTANPVASLYQRVA